MTVTYIGTMYILQIENTMNTSVLDGLTLSAYMQWNRNINEADKLKYPNYTTTMTRIK